MKTGTFCFFEAQGKTKEEVAQFSEFEPIFTKAHGADPKGNKKSCACWMFYLPSREELYKKYPEEEAKAVYRNNRLKLTKEITQFFNGKYLVVDQEELVRQSLFIAKTFGFGRD